MKNIKNSLAYKIIAILFCCMVAFFTFPQSVRADVLPMIPGDFFMQYSGDCTYDGRTYFADSNIGEVTMYESPLDVVAVGSYQNGEEINIEYTYQADGVLWGGSSKGWFVMDNLGVVYDNTQFWIDNANEITAYDGEIFEIPIAYAYTYPNSGEYREISENKDYMYITEAINSVYTDENGNRWGYVVYYFGRINRWVCLSDTTNAELGGGVMENIPSNASVSGEDTIVQEALLSSSNLSWLAVVVVAVIVTISLILIVKTKKRN